jgi:protein required for attachment to host cells
MDEHEAESFAREISGFLLKSMQERRFQKLTLIAAPKFLGALRTFLDPQLKSLVGQELDKDYTHFSGQQLRDQLKAFNARQ